LASKISEIEQEKNALSRFLANVEAEHREWTIAHSRAANAQQPINLLPDTVIESILLYTYNGMTKYDPSGISWGRNHYKTLNVLMSVCHRWFARVIGLPWLWQKVFFAPEIPFARSSLNLSRAGATTISCIVDMESSNVPPDWFTDMGSLVIPSFPRCHQITLKGYEDTMVSFLPLNSPIPTVESMHIAMTANDYTEKPFLPPLLFGPGLGPTISLSVLHLKVIKRTSWKSAPFGDILGLGSLNLESLSQLTIDFDLANELRWDFLRQCSNLEMLEVIHDSFVNPRHIVSSAHASEEVIYLPHLSSAKFRGVPRLSSFEVICVPSLQELDVRALVLSTQPRGLSSLDSSNTPHLRSLTAGATEEEYSVEAWTQFLEAQPLLELFRCFEPKNFLVALQVHRSNNRKSRLRHVDILWSLLPHLVDPPLRRGQAQELMAQLSDEIIALLPPASQALAEDVPGLRFTLNLNNVLPRFRKYLSDEIRNHPQVRVIPLAEPWGKHPEWPVGWFDEKGRRGGNKTGNRCIRIE
ncbi:hypothetical protein DL93DRAFT_2086427, partial [Clavulina sp. PMI_390]